MTKLYEMDEETLKYLSTFKNNPAKIIETTYQMLYGITEGNINVPNPNNPFSYLLEASAVQAAIINNSNEEIYRNQYPALADKWEHLYNHMFSHQYVGRFATPGKAEFQILFKYGEMIKALKDNEDSDGKRRIIIPRGSYITCLDYVFTFLYPIEIRQLPHEGIQVIYITDVEDPIQKMNTNIVDWDIVTYENEPHIRLKIQLYNVKLLTSLEGIASQYSYRRRAALEGKYCHTLMYHSTNGKKKEIYTTHSELVHDPYKPTARLKYLGDELDIVIPPIYQSKNLIGDVLYTEIYVTAGKVEEPLNEYGSDMFSHKWAALDDNVEDTKYVSILEELSTPLIYATSMLYGGTDGETFDECRERVINFTNYVKTPITPDQLKIALKMNGYDINKTKDILTERTYIASRELASNINGDLKSPIGSAVITVKSTFNELVKHTYNVRDNKKRLTIMPGTLFKDKEGLFDIVPIELVPNPDALGIDNYLSEVNKLEYLYVPFHYVLDTIDNFFNVRAYYLQNPELLDQTFIKQNDTAGYNVSSENFTIIPYRELISNTNGQYLFDEGYKLRFHVRANKEYKELAKETLIAQLAVKPIGENRFAYTNGTLVGVIENDYENDMESDEPEDYFWEFTFKTNWNLTQRNGIIIGGLSMNGSEQAGFEIPLESQFYIIHGLKQTVIEGHEPNDVDKLFYKPLIDDSNIVGISVERFGYRLGYQLNKLWSNAYAVQKGREYEKWEYDIPRVYRHDVYDISPEGDFILNEDDLVVKHRAGDPVTEDLIDKASGMPVLDDEGNPVQVPTYFARKGDVKLDRFGNPIIAAPRQLERVFDLVVLDAVYSFSTDDTDKRYVEKIINNLKTFTITDLNDISKRLLERTSLYFYPKQTIGKAKAIIDNNKEVELPLRVSFKLTVYQKDSKYQDNLLRASIENEIKDILTKSLLNRTVSVSDITKRIYEKCGNDIVSVVLDKFNEGPFTFDTYTVLDYNTRRSIKQIIKYQQDGTYKVSDDIEITFLQHEYIRERSLGI